MGGLSATLRALEELLGPYGHALAGVAVWTLGLLFVWSGSAKLRSPGRAAIAIVEFGVARTARRELGLLLGSGELVLGLALLFLPGLAVWATAGAFLLWVFVVLIARSLAGGSRFDCFCLGEADAPISAVTLLRTTALAASATVVALTAARYGVGHAVWDDAGLLQATSAVTLIGSVVLTSKIRQLVTLDARRPAGAGA